MGRNKNNKYANSDENNETSEFSDSLEHLNEKEKAPVKKPMKKKKYGHFSKISKRDGINYV